MMQQINLYQPIFRKEEKVFSARTLLIGNLLVFVGIMALYGLNLWQVSSLQLQLSQTIHQREENQRQVEQLSAQYPLVKRDAQLTGKLSHAKERLTFLHEVRATLTSQTNGAGDGFSEHLAGLSRQDIPQLWLNQITISAGGRELRLHGSTMSSDRVPYYIQQLGRESIFQGTSFHRLAIHRPIDKNAAKLEPPSKVIHFTLETALKLTSEFSEEAPTQNPSEKYLQWHIKSPGQILEERMR